MSPSLKFCFLLSLLVFPACPAPGPASSGHASGHAPTLLTLDESVLAPGVTWRRQVYVGLPLGGNQTFNLLEVNPQIFFFHTKMRQTKNCQKLPNQQRSLNKLPPEFRCRNFVNNY